MFCFQYSCIFKMRALMDKLLDLNSLIRDKVSKY